MTRYESARQKTDLAATVLQDVGLNRHGGNIFIVESRTGFSSRSSGYSSLLNLTTLFFMLLSYASGLLDALAKSILADANVIGARILALNISNGVLSQSVWWSKQMGGIGDPHRIEDDGLSIGLKPNGNYPW